MALQVRIVSKEIIKPSSPTPDHLRILKLSFLDQHMWLCSLPVLLFYAASDSDGDHEAQTQLKLDRLKKSLSQILTHFYPLAGRVRDNHVAECNDEGVNFFEARVNGALNQYLTNPIPEEMDGLLPHDDFYELKVLLSIQVNIFECGGIAVGVQIGHKVADASSLSSFINSWAAMAARGDNDGEDNVLDLPTFDMTSLFPPKDLPFTFFPIGIPKEKLVVNRRFVFNASNISALKAKCSNSLYVKNPTRVEAIYSLLWRCAMDALTMREGSSSSSAVLVLPMNLRPRMDPPLSNLCIGNPLIRVAISSSTHENNPPELDFFVSQLRKTLRGVDSEYVRKLRVGDGISLHNASLDEVFLQYNKGEVELYFFTSWCRFPFYEADFGWGKPEWVGFVGGPVPNNIMMLDTKCGNGVEAWVSLLEEDMARFEAHPELLAFSTDCS